MENINKILNIKQNVIEEGSLYSERGALSQINFEIKRGFADENQITKNKDIKKSAIGEKISILSEGSVRATFKKVKDNVFEVVEQNTNEKMNNPRNNPTPAGAYNQDFGRQFMATGGNSIPKKNFNPKVSKFDSYF